MTNAITRRLDLLQGLWDDFVLSSKAGCCCWLVEQDELTMIDAFFQVNADESSDTSEIFLRLASPFHHAEQYSQALVNELAALVDADREELAADDIFIDWQANYKKDTNNSALGFLKEFFQFSVDLELEESRVIAFLSPTEVQRPAAWQKWWADVTELQLPDKIRLMVCDTIGEERLQDLAQAKPESIAILSADLDMPNAIRELMNEYGDQEDDCTHFRKAFYELTQAVGQRAPEQITSKAKAALSLARQIGFPHLEIAVLCITGNGFMMCAKKQSGITAFDEAIRIAEEAKDKPMLPEFPDLKVELPGGNLFEQLAVQSLFFKAAGFLSLNRPDYAAAQAVYQETEQRLVQMLPKPKQDKEIDWSNGGIIHFHRLEALRMTAFCQEQQNRTQGALEDYQTYIAIAEQLPPDLLESTMLPFVGQAVLKICQKKAMKEQYWTNHHKMEELLGKNWEEKLPKA